MVHARSFLVTGPRLQEIHIKYTKDHEWVGLLDDSSVRVGITAYAADALGDVTFVELPQVGDTVAPGESIGSVESVKSASEVYSPVAGEIVAVNSDVEENSKLLNEDPLGAGWMVQIKVADPSEIDAKTTDKTLLSQQEYEEYLKESS